MGHTHQAVSLRMCGLHVFDRTVARGVWTTGDGDMSLSATTDDRERRPPIDGPTSSDDLGRGRPV